jgi:hypothetical protein
MKKRQNSIKVLVSIVLTLIVIGISLFIYSNYTSSPELDLEQRIQEEVDLINSTAPQNLQYEFVGPNTGAPQPFNTTPDVQIQN